MITQQDQRDVMYWFRESIVVKLACIGVLLLAMLIPSVWIQGLITERSDRQTQIISSVSDQWSGAQQIQGPLLIIPYKRQVKETDAAQKELTRDVKENIYLLPDDLHIKAVVQSSKLHRGIFDVGVYNTRVRVSGSFAAPDFNKLMIAPSQLTTGKMRLVFSISDLKGLKTNPVVTLGGVRLNAEPVFDNKSGFANGLQVTADGDMLKSGRLPFDFTLDLKGSQELSFLHLGKTTEVEASGDWPDPSFSGRYLPDTRSVGPGGFSAKWKMLYYNRPYPQQWAADDTLLTNVPNHNAATFGVKLHIPVDEYQKTMRTSKYAVLIILLTFISLLLTELIGKQRIHIFNYMLIGAAMVIYYTLLLSFSEQIGYNWAYLIASVATITLISVFMASLLKNRKAALLFAGILSLFYGFIFIIIQLEDLSLLVGSIALLSSLPPLCTSPEKLAGINIKGMTTRFVYAVKVWLTAVLLPPLAIMLFNIIPVETLAYLTNVYMIMVIAGAIFSLPGFLLLWLTAYLPENSRFYPANKKMLLSAMALIYIAIVSGWLLDFDFSDRIPLIYALIIIGGIWLCDSMPGAHSRADYPANTQA